MRRTWAPPYCSSYLPVRPSRSADGTLPTQYNNSGAARAGKSFIIAAWTPHHVGIKERAAGCALVPIKVEKRGRAERVESFTLAKRVDKDNSVCSASS